MDKSTLKPCPFCGGQAEFQDGSIKCSKCGLTQRHHVLHDSSVKAWNMRYEEDNCQQELTNGGE